MKSTLRESANIILSQNKNQGKSPSGLSLIAGLILAVSSGNEAIAQPITPALDGTGTQVQQNGNQFDITGGSRGGAEGANLFHSFEQFGLDANQTANFLATPELRNILGRVVGGDPSIINGLIQVSGGNPNLFLMNPSGIVFGQNASLNVPASFFATTANGIKLGDNQWFAARGSNNYATLVGEPRAFSFSGLNGALANFGELTVNPGQSLGLSGSSVLNAGTLTAPGGEITITAVPGTNTILLGQPGHLLSLEIDNSGLASLQQPTNLPSLLTNNASTHASQVTVNSDGTVTLAGSSLNNVPTTAGTAIVAGNLDVSGHGALGIGHGALGTVHPSPSLPQVPQSPGLSVPPFNGPQVPKSPSPPVSRSPDAPTVGIFGQQLGIAADIDASGAIGGGRVFIGGDRLGEGSLPTALNTFVGSDSNINADALTNGNGGSVIVWADNNTFFDGTISARGGLTGGDGGFVETSGKINLNVGSSASVDASAINGQPGEWLLDPSDITISNGSTTATVFGGRIFFAGGGSANVTPATIEASLNGGTSVTVTTASLGSGGNGDITVTDAISKTAGGEATLTLDADRHININSGANIISSSDKLNLVLEAERAISITGATITTNGGNFTATGSSSGAEGIEINNSTINSGAGSITMTRTGAGIGSNNEGIEVSSSTIESNSGSISINGTGAGIGSNNEGIEVSSSTIESNSGSISITGTGAGGGSNNQGIDVESSTIESNSGSISITGTGSGIGSSNQGILVDNNSTIESTGSGNITLTGFGGSGTEGNDGVEVDSASIFGRRSIVRTNSGSISITGTGAGTGSNNKGIDVQLSTIESTGGGNITLTGTGGSGTDGNDGVEVNFASVRTNGSISINGTGAGSGSSNEGIDVGNIAIESTGGGNITLTGTGAAGEPGILLSDSSINPSATATGNITLTSDEIDITGTSQIQSSGNLQIQPLTPSANITVGGSADTGTGILDITAGDLSTLVDGFASITIGRSDSSGTISIDSSGATFQDPVTLQSPSGGSIAVNGNITGTGDASITLNKDTTLNANIVTADRDIAINGNTTLGNAASLNTGTGSGNISFNGTVDTSTTLSAIAQDLTLDAGTGNITVTGAVGNSQALGNLTATTSGTTQFDSTVAAGNIQLTSGEVNFGSTVSGSGSLTIEPASASQNISIGGSSDSGSALDLTATDINNLGDGFSSITIGSASGSGSISIESGGASFKDPVTLQSPSGSIAINGNLAGTSDASVTLAGNTNLNANIDTANQNIAINGNTTLGNAASLNTGSGSGNIDLNGTVDSSTTLSAIAQDLTLDAGTGKITVTGAVGNSSALGNIIANSSGTTKFNSSVNSASLTTDALGSTQLNGSVTTTGTQSYNDLVTVIGDITLKADELDIGNTFAGLGNLSLEPIDAGQALAVGGTGATSAWDLTAAEVSRINGFASLTIGRSDGSGKATIAGGTFSVPTTIQSPGGSIALNGSITGIGNASITLESPTIDLSGSIATDNQNILLNGEVSLSGASSLNTSSGLGNITFTGKVDGNQNLTLNAGSGLVNFQAAAGAMTALGGLTINSASAVNSNGGISTDNSSLNFTMPVNLTGDSSFDVGSATANFGNSLSAGSHNLTVTAGEVNFGNSVTGTGTLELRPASASGEIQLGGTDAGTGALELSSAELGQIQDGFSSLIIGRSDGNGAITVDSSGVSFSDPVTLRSPLPGGLLDNLIVNGTINLTDNSSLTLEIYRAQLNANIISAGGNIDLGNAKVTLGSDAMISTGTAGGDINIGGTIDGTVGANGRMPSGQAPPTPLLTLNAGTGQVSLGGDIGQNNPLLGLSLTGGTASLPNLITTDNGNITINANASLNGGDSDFSAGTGTIEFGSSLSAGTNNLTLTADEINLNGGSSSVSGSGILTLQPTTPTLDINIANATDTTAALDLNSGDVDALQNGFAEITIGRADGNGAITMETATFSDPVRLRSPVDGGTLSINGAVTLLDDGKLTRNIPGLVEIFEGFQQDSGDIIFSEDVLLREDVEFIAKSGNIIFEGLLDGNQNLTLSATGFIEFQKAVGAFEPLGNLTMNAAEVRVAGGITTYNNPPNQPNDTIEQKLLFNMPVTLLGDSTFNAVNGELEFNDVLNAGSHQLGLVADEIDINNTVSGTGALEIQPKTSAGNIIIAGTDNNTQALDITATELSQIQEGFSSITIGQTDGTGTVSVNSFSTSDPTRIRAGLGEVNIDGAITGTDNASIDIDGGTVNLGANISTAGENITIGSKAILNTDISLDTGAGGGDITFTGTLNSTSAGSQALTLNAGSGGIRFEDVAGGSNPLSGLSLEGSDIYLKGSISVDSDLTFDMPVTIEENSEINAGTGSLTFNDALDAGTFDLTLTADEIDLAAALTGTGNLLLQPATDSLDIAVAGTGNSGGLDLSAAEISQISNQFESLTIGSATGSGNITVENVTFDSATTVRSPSGSLSVLGDITSNSELSLGATNLNLNANISSNGSTTLDGNTSLGADVTINSNNNSIAINGTIDGTSTAIGATSTPLSANGQELTLNAGSGQVQLGGAVGGTNPLSSLRVTAASTDISGTVATNNGDINFSGSVTVSGSGGSFSAGEGTLSFGSSLAALSQQDLTLTADEIDFNGSISSGGSLVLQPATSSRNIAIAGTAESSGTFDLTADEINNLQDGFRSITIGRDDGSGTVTIDSITLSDPTTVQVPFAPGSIALNGDTSLTDNGSLTLTAPALNLNANIESQGGDVLLSGNVTLGADATIDTNNGGIGVEGSIDGNYSLSLNAGSDRIGLAGAVGSIAPLTGLSAISSQVFLGGAITTNNGDISFSGDVTAIGFANSFNAGTGTLSFGSALVAQSQQDLTLTADEINLGGTVSSQGNLILQPASPGLAIAIGSSQQSAVSSQQSVLDLSASEISNLQDGFASVTIGRADGSGAVSIDSISLSDPTTVQVRLEPGTIDVNGDVALTDNGGLTLISPTTDLAGDIASSGGAIAINSPAVSLDSDVTLSSSSGDINIEGAVDGFHQLILDAGSGNASFGGSLGENTPLASLRVAAQAAALNGNINTDGGDVNIQAAISLLGDLVVNANPDATNAGTNEGGGNFTVGGAIDGAYALTVEANNVEIGDVGGSESVRSINIDAQGDVNLGNATISGGDASIAATGDVSTGNISTVPIIPEEPSGNIDLNSTAGSVNTGNLDSRASGDGGNISISAASDISAGNITSSSNSASAGDIDITSSGGSIATQDIAAESLGVDAGDISFSAADSISTGDVSQQGGDIDLTAARSITTGNISSRSVAGEAGDISLNAVEDITVGNINSDGFTNAGGITIVSQEGSVTAGNIQASSESGAAGEIALEAAGNVSTGTIQAVGNDTAGTVNLTSTNGGTIETGEITAVATATGEQGQVNIEEIVAQEAAPEEAEAIQDEETAGGEPPIVPGEVESSQETPAQEEAETAGEGGEPTAVQEDETTAVQGGSPSIGEGFDNPEEQLEETAPAAVEAEQEAVREANLSLDNVELEPEELEGVTAEEVEAIAELGQEALIETSPLLASEASEANNNTSGVVGNFSIASETVNADSTGATLEPSGFTEINSNAAQQFVSASLSGRETATATSTIGNSSSSGAQVESITNQQQQILNALGITAANNLAMGNIAESVPQIEESQASEYAEYFGDESLEDAPVTAQGIRDTLSNIIQETGTKPAIVYGLVLPDQLEIVLVTPDGRPMRKVVSEAPKELLIKTIRKFRGDLTNPRLRNSTRYKQNAQLLYKWLIAPIERELQENNIDTLLFSMDSGLRSLPIAALHDGEQFLVEKYSLGLIPSISLTNTRYRSLQNTQVLAMGASEFPEDAPLPAVPTELETITEQVWQGKAFLNEDFTRDNLLSERDRHGYEIVHLATHGQFKKGAPENSYIHFGDRKLGLDELRELRLRKPQVELLVLSACRTALGDESAELGFAGLAVQAGVKSALASLWSVSDEGTLALMTEFYTNLAKAPIKAEALRSAQIAMIAGEVRIEDGRVSNSGTQGGLALPKDLAAMSDRDLSHPYYWSAFTMIGSPW
ncbi:MAG: CHAT domain-containing protein [Oscillatoria sp. SIO1A7]|nr:CHAT domain-containing protein [Oscillatoria sp. SIO1A7]